MGSEMCIRDSGIGKAAAHRIAKEGAHLVCADLDHDLAQQTAQELTDIHGIGIGVAGTGISNCGAAIGMSLDITNRESIRQSIRNTILAYGGIDHVIITAGLFAPPSADGRISDAMWRKTFEVNLIGSYLAVDEIRNIWQQQNLQGSLVLTTSANAAVAKKGSMAYDSSKAAANHLVRELAIELAPNIRVNGLAPATVVEGSSMFPRERVISSLIKYDIAFSETEATEALRAKLAGFYASRTLTNQPVTMADQAEIACLLISDKFSKTTGQIISVDGGLVEAFLR